MVAATMAYARIVPCIGRVPLHSTFHVWCQPSLASRAYSSKRVQAQKKTQSSYMPQSYKYVCLGGGNSSGYLAKELVAGGLKAGELCIITDEPVSIHTIPHSAEDELYSYLSCR